MIVFTGADLVLPNGVQNAAPLVVDGDRIVDVGGSLARGGEHVDVSGHIILPGFIDVHVHGSEGVDTLDGGDAIAAIARSLPKYGVTAFCPTTVACSAHALRE